MKITSFETADIRFPTSQQSDGSDAMNPDPDYSAAYVIFHTDANVEGHGLTFTIGRGNDLCVAAIEQLAPRLVGRTLDSITSDWGATWREITGDSQLRWLGPEKGVVHLATAAVVNALWDLYSKAEGKPLWRLLCDMSPEEVVRSIDFRYITDHVTPDEALSLLKELQPSRDERIETLLRRGYPAYTTSIGWMGYSDEKIQALCREALAEGFTAFKMKVGRNVDDDVRRAGLIRARHWSRQRAHDGRQSDLGRRRSDRVDGPAR